MFRPEIFAFLVVLWSIPAAAEPDPRITGIADQVSVTHLEATVRRLEAFGTRYTFSDSAKAVAQWLIGQFQEIGYSDVQLDMFRLEGVLQGNVVVMKPGKARWGEEVVLGAHYDSIVRGNADPRISAPGANDNATGVAAVLEVSRLLRDIPLKRSVRFVLFAAEEVGLYGSADYARKARNRGDDIRLMLNLDEIGYNPEQFAGTMLVLTGFSYLHFGEITAQALKEYGGLTPLRLDGRGAVETWDCRCSDHQSFLDVGYPAVLLSERDPISYPYGHTIFDRIEKVDLSLVTGITKGALATTIITAGLAGETVVEKAGWGEIKKRTLARWYVKR
jgi:Zn-dependent M28 family amino/carboxypeptidase